MLKSELFHQSYCIFVNEVTKEVEDKIRSFGIQSIKLLKATFNKDLFCIVIPTTLAVKIYEDDLFKVYREYLPKSGFWGQYGMGYSGKVWEIL